MSEKVVQLVQPPKQEVDPLLLKLLDDMLVLAKSGTIIGVVVSVMHSDGNPGSYSAGDMDLIEQIGVIEITKGILLERVLDQRIDPPKVPDEPDK